MNATILFVPGLRGHVPEHWQTLLAQELKGSRTVPPLEQDGLSCAARVEALDRCIAEIRGPVILVAHSAGCLITVHWAAQRTRRIKAALLATPPDITRPLPEGYPTFDALEAGGWLPVPRARLPFPSLVASSSNDPLADAAEVASLARDWGSNLMDLGEVGHLNPAAGFGPWPLAGRLIAGLEQSA
jgi:predicted alpha/beta hydrolase family esterase